MPKGKPKKPLTHRAKEKRRQGQLRSTKVGRPSILTEETKGHIVMLYREGKTDAEVADIVEVHVNTVRAWRKYYPQFQWAVNEAKLEADKRVERALYNRAIGYDTKEVKAFYDKDRGEIVTEEVDKHYPPDITAAKFWLTNRQSKHWREKIESRVEASLSLESLVAESFNPELKDVTPNGEEGEEDDERDHIDWEEGN